LVQQYRLFEVQIGAGRVGRLGRPEPANLAETTNRREQARKRYVEGKLLADREWFPAILRSLKSSKKMAA